MGNGLVNDGLTNDGSTRDEFGCVWRLFIAETRGEFSLWATGIVGNLLFTGSDAGICIRLQPGKPARSVPHVTFQHL